MNLEVALLSLGVALLTFIVRKGWQLNRKLVLGLNDIIGSQDRPSLYAMMQQQGEQLAAIDKELHPNGGTSMRDQIVRVERDVAEVKVMAAKAEQKAAVAASEAEGLSGAVARFHHDARQRADVADRERRGVQESLDVLLRELSKFAAKGYQKERAYVAALREIGVDLTHITDQLDDEE